MRHALRTTVIALTVTAATSLGIAPVDAAVAETTPATAVGTQQLGWMCRLLRLC